MKNLDHVREKLSPARRRKIENGAAGIMAEEMTLRQIHEALNRTQVVQPGHIDGIATSEALKVLREAKRKAPFVSEWDQWPKEKSEWISE